MRDAIPKDMRYRVRDFNVLLYRGEQKINEINVQDERVQLIDFLKDAQKGDKLMIEVKRVQRMNFKGEVEDVKVGMVNFQVTIG